MRTVNFQVVRDQILRMMGWNPDVATPLQVARVTEYVQCNLRQGWESDFFPEWSPLEERSFDSGTQNIGRFQTGETPIGEFYGVYPSERDGQRDQIDGSGRRYNIYHNEDGITVLDCGESTVWVKFRRQFPRFTTVVFDDEATYVAGEEVLMATTGECYIARYSSATPPVLSWELQGFPAIMEQVVVMQTMADLSRAEAQPERADGFEARAAAELIRVGRVMSEQQQLLRRGRFRAAY